MQLKADQKEKLEERKNRKKNISIDNLDDKLKEAIICAICTDYILPSPVTCTNNHIICRHCGIRCDFKCTVCRTTSSMTTAKKFETFFKYLDFKCRNDECDMILPYQNFIDHMSVCPHDQDLQNLDNRRSRSPSPCAEIIPAGAERLPGILPPGLPPRFARFLPPAPPPRFAGIIPSGAEHDIEVVGHRGNRRRRHF